MKGFRSLFLVALVTLMGACAPGDPIPGAAPAPTVASGAGAQQTAVPQAAPGAPQLAGPGTGAVINHATSLKSGATGVINWGYGPWGETGVVYPKIDPNGQVPMGPSQLVTEFNGNNWRDSGSWKFTLPSGYSEVLATTQGDAPLEVTVQGNTLTMTSNAAVSAKALDAPDKVKRPTRGSTGVSLVVFVK